MQLLVNIDVDALKPAVSFYCTAFDLRVGRRFGQDGVELLGGSSPIYLLVRPEGSRATAASEQARRYERHWCPVHLDFVVADIDAALRRAVNAGARLEQPVRRDNWGKLAMLADPFGHGFCLVEFIGRGYDEIASSDEGPGE